MSARGFIALFNALSHPLRDSVENTLHLAFPEYDIENIWLRDIIKARWSWAPGNLGFLAREYGKDFLTRRVNAKARYLQTTYLFRRVRGIAQRLVNPRRHVFSFQFGSMYDTSVPGVPHFVYTDHTHLSNLANPWFDRRTLRSPAWIALERTIYHNAASVFTLSTNVAADLVNHYGVAAAKVVCVYAGASVQPPPNYRPANEDYSNRHILFVGRDWERKGGPDLVAAFRQVIQLYPDAHLTIAGASPALTLPNCTVLGPLPVNELTDHFAKASVFCLPTRVEPFGIAFLEAMIHRLPIVATRVEAVPEIVQDGVTGELVAPGDTPALAQALIRLLGDPPLCRRYGNNGYHRAVEVYTWDRVGERIRSHILPIVHAASAHPDAPPSLADRSSERPFEGTD